MKVPQMKGFLKKVDKSKIKISGSTQRKIEEAHNVPIEEVFWNLESPTNLIAVQLQESRRKHEDMYRLYFRKTDKKKLKVVIKYKKLDKRLYIITAHYMTRKTDRLVKPIKSKRIRR